MTIDQQYNRGVQDDGECTIPSKKLEDMKLSEIIELKQITDCLYGKGVFYEAARREVLQLVIRLLKENEALSITKNNEPEGGRLTLKQAVTGRENK